MDRRKFLEKTTPVVVGVASGAIILSGCDSGGEGILGSGGGSKSPKNPYDDWTPSINNNPYPLPDFSIARDTTGENGEVSFYDHSDQSFFGGTFFDSWIGPNSKVSELEVTLFREYRQGDNTGFLLATDPQGRFMPNMTSINLLPPRYIEMRKPEDSSLRCDTRFGELVCSLGSNARKDVSSIDHNLFINEIKGSLPSYDPGKMGDIPGYFYWGDFSFDNLKNLNTILKYSSLVLAVPTKGASLKAYAILEKTGSVLESLDLTIQGINIVNNIKYGEDLIDMGQKYSIYNSIKNSPYLLLFPSLMSDRSTEYDIKDLLPLNQGNSWTYNDGRQSTTMRVADNKMIKGKNLGVVRSVGGLEEYFGFHNSVLNYYGFNLPGLGDVFFDPSIKLGDNRVRVGSKYQNIDSRVIAPDIDISGKITEIYECVGRQNILTSNNTPFGDCFRIKENASISLSKGDKTVSDSFEAERWYAHNLGPVKIESMGQTIELINSNINSRMQGFSLFKEASEENGALIPSIPQKIMEAYQRVR